MGLLPEQSPTEYLKAENGNLYYFLISIRKQMVKAFELSMLSLAVWGALHLFKSH